MKKFLLFALLATFLPLPAETFPDPIAEFRGQPIPRASVGEQLKSLGDLSPDDRTGRRAALRKILEDFCCGVILDDISRMAEYRDGTASARRYIAELHLDEATERELQKKVDDPEFIQKAVLHLFLVSRYGNTAFEVGDDEIESFYRQNIGRFRVAGDIVFGVIAADDPDTAETYHARLMQGENFERIARESDDGKKRPEELSASDIQMLRETAAKMQVNDISAVIPRDHRYFILKLQKRTPPSFIPLAKIKDALRMELVAFREARLLQQYLAEQIDEGKLILKE